MADMFPATFDSQSVRICPSHEQHNHGWTCSIRHFRLSAIAYFHFIRNTITADMLPLFFWLSVGAYYVCHERAHNHGWHVPCHFFFLIDAGQFYFLQVNTHYCNVRTNLNKKIFGLVVLVLLDIKWANDYRGRECRTRGGRVVTRKGCIYNTTGVLGDIWVLQLLLWKKKIYIFACILRFTFFWYEDCMVYKITKVESFIKVWSKKKQQRRPGYSNN